jgi:prepilin-type N-terminal cleavage/methylation domain-containing protein
MKKIKAFTLVETLIVIVVFCIGILAVLQWLSQTLRNKDYANTQIKAAFFAREWIELVFNLRDANYHKELQWNCVFNNEADISNFDVGDDLRERNNPFCKWYLWSDGYDYITIWMWSGNEYIHVDKAELSEKFDDNLSNFPIYLHTWNFADWVTTGYYYNHQWEDYEKTWFARYLVITSVDWVNNDENLLKIESHVLFQRGYLTWEKVMETFIWNYEFNQ